MVKISNLKLIKILERNGRISYTELAKIFGVTEAAVRKRIKEMKAKGIIKKFRTDFDYQKINMIEAIVGVDTLPEKFLKVIEELKKMDEIFSLATSSGDHQIMFEASFTSYEELKNFIERIEKMEGVTKICPAIVLEKIK